MIKITSEHEDALERLLAEEGWQADDIIPRIDDAMRAPLSDYQWSLWLALEADSTDANVPLVFAIGGGPVDTTSLELALRTIAERHEVLRSLVVVEDGQPWQVPQPADGVSLQRACVDADDVNETINTFVGQPLDVRSEIPFRAHFLTASDDTHYLVIVAHHLAFDGWSIGVLQEELREAYSQLRAGLQPALPELKFRHLDFSLWQASEAGRKTHREGLAYWKRRLDGANARLAWPGSAGSAGIGEDAGANFTQALDSELVAQVREFAAVNDTTPFVVMLAAYVETLSRYCYQDDLCVGTPAAARDRLELEKLIGCFVNTLVVRYRRRPAETFSELVRRIGRQVHKVREHQTVPFHSVIRATEVGRGPFQPFTQAMFAYQTEASGMTMGFSCGELHFEPHRYQRDQARYELLLTVLSACGDLIVNFEHRKCLFSSKRIALLAASYTELLSGLVTQPDQPLATISAQADPPKRCAQAGLQAPVAQAQDRTLPSHLKGSSAELARRLAGADIGAGDRVLLACHSADAVAMGVYAAALVGASSVVPERPLSAGEADVLAQRYHFAAVLAGSEATNLPAGTLFVPLKPFQVSGNVEYADRDIRLSPAATAAVACARFVSGDPELLLFPVTRVLAALETLDGLRGAWRDAGDEDSPFAYAMAALARITGGESSSADVSGIPVGDGAASAHLKIGTPQAPAEHLADITAPFSYLLRVPGCVASLGRCEVEAKGSGMRFEPASGARIALMRGDAEPAGPATAGELLVGGGELAWGYAGDPCKTAERFVPDPDASTPGARLFRTGEIFARDEVALRYVGNESARLRRHGHLYYLFELESVLNAHPQVRSCRLVVDDGGPHNDIAIAARLVPDAGGTGGTPSVQGLREYLQKRLPASMVPAQFRVVGNDALAKETSELVGNADSCAPDPVTVESTEELLISVWREALERTGVTRHDNFFELGGDSILCLRVQSLAQKRGVFFSIDEIFSHQTIADLAPRCRLDGEEAETVAPFALIRDADRERLPADADAAYPLSRLQAGMFYHYRLSPERGLYHDVIHYWLEGDIDVGLLCDCTSRILSQADTCRSTFHIAGFNEPLQIVHRDRRVPVTRVEHAASDVDDVIAAWTEDEIAKGFDAGREPPIRCTVHCFGALRCVLSYSFHHALLDGWSEAQATADILQLYSSPCVGAQEMRHEKRLPYRKFIALERGAEHDESQRTFWRDYLKDLEPFRVPRIRNAPEEQVVGAAQIDLDEKTSVALQCIAGDMKVSPKSVLLAVHTYVLGSITARTDVVTGMAFNCRPETEGGERALGLFLNTLPVRLRMDEIDDWKGLIAAAAQAEAELAAYRRFPLLAITNITGDKRPFEVLFNYTHFHNYRQIDAGSRLTITARTGTSANSLIYAANFWTDPHDGRIYGSFSTPPDETAHGRRIVRLYEDAIAALTADPASTLPDLSHFREEISGLYQSESEAGTEAAEVAKVQGPPTTDTEKVIASIWIGILGVPTVDRGDSFYSLGGDSLAAMRLVAELERVYEADVPMATIFENPRLSEFCSALERHPDFGMDVAECSRLLVEVYEKRVRANEKREIESECHEN